MSIDTVTPYFIPAAEGNLFALYYAPELNENKHCIIHIPAFAEEMNKSRRMVAMQSRAFMQQGQSVLVFDLLGTGDSAGEFAEATWQGWLDNIATVIEWLKLQGIERFSFWGLRTGVLLALDFLQHSKQPIQQLICWQPVLKGENFIMQFLRLRIAAAMMNSQAPQEKTADLKRALLAGESIEVAGYLLNPELVLPMMQLQAQKMSLDKLPGCLIFELISDAEATASYACLQWHELLQQSDCELALELVQGSSFWTTQEIAEVLALVELTTLKVCA